MRDTSTKKRDVDLFNLFIVIIIGGRIKIFHRSKSFAHPSLSQFWKKKKIKEYVYRRSKITRIASLGESNAIVTDIRGVRHTSSKDRRAPPTPCKPGLTIFVNRTRSVPPYLSKRNTVNYRLLWLETDVVRETIVLWKSLPRCGRIKGTRNLEIFPPPTWIASFDFLCSTTTREVNCEFVRSRSRSPIKLNLTLLLQLFISRELNRETRFSNV